MSTMYPTIERLYNNQQLDIQGVKNAVVKGWITAEEFKTITGQDYVA